METEEERTLIRNGMLCTRCMEKVLPQKLAKGSLAIEVVLWIFFLIPGVIYSIWRRTDKLKACPSCGSIELVPFQSERAKTILGEKKWSEITALQTRYAAEIPDRSWDV